MSDSNISLFSHSSASTPAAEDELDLVHDEQFYLRIVVFRAGKTLFKVPTYSFPADEGLFASMFLLPKGDDEPEGSSDKNPIRLPPEVSATDFKSLLKACLPQSVARAPPKPHQENASPLGRAQRAQQCSSSLVERT